MVFLIQNTQNRDAKAAHLKLDEVIRALKGARNELIDLEKLAHEDSPALRNSSSVFAKKQSGTETSWPHEAERTALNARPRIRAFRRATETLPPTHTLFVPNAIRLSELKVGAIINTSSGSYDSESEQKMLSILKRAGVVEPKVWCGEAKEMERFFAEAAGQKLEVLIVLGGDGTIRTAAEACAEKGSYLIPLPGGR